jgi:hypothetical protein
LQSKHSIDCSLSVEPGESPWYCVVQ